MSEATVRRGALGCAWCGVKDVVFGLGTPVRSLSSSSELREHVLACFVLNGIVFLGSMMLFSYVVHPLLLRIMKLTAGDSGAAADLSPWFSAAMMVIYNVFWVYPIFVLAKILNSLYYQDIADTSFRISKGRKGPAAGGLRTRSVLEWLAACIADVIYTTILELFLIVQISILGLIPTVGRPLSFVFSCWLASLYCFEYTWINAGWTLPKRLDFFQRHWAYFLGWGLPFTLMTYFIPFFHASAVFAIFFPFFIIIAVCAKPVPSDQEHSFLGLMPDYMPICRQARWLTDRAMRFLPSSATKGAPTKTS